jgi:hypothetical protein
MGQEMRDSEDKGFLSMRSLPGGEPQDPQEQPEEQPVVEGVIVRPVRRNGAQYLIPGILLVALIIGVFILAYGIGVDQGKRAANDERNAFYQERIARLVGSVPLTADPNATPGATTSPNGVQTMARIDKIEGDRVTVILLNPNGAPTGVSLVVVLGRPVQVYKSSDSQVSELKPGDNVLINGDKVGDSYTARTITILASSS